MALPQFTGKLKVNINKNDWKLVIRFEEDNPNNKPLWETEDLNLIEVDPDYVGLLISQLEQQTERLLNARKREKEILNTTNFSRLYTEFEHKYNEYPVMMSAAEAFGHALADGLIDEDTYDAAHKYYGRMWCYVGD